ncbi:ATP-dependent Clp protease proteolytic subunit [bacterium]|nr:ATP-dependent Clp protease proteolytic subunit [bacterium]MDB4128582.1 ATP-dependent Clp protease proteolytic subunit [bacterium]
MAKKPVTKKKKTKEKALDTGIIPTPKTTPTPPPVAMPQPPMPPKKPGEALYENGVLFMDKEFTQENCMPLVRMIMEYNMMPAETRPEVIHLYINSPGGAVNSAFHLIDVIKQSEIPVYTYGMGMIASCGVLLMMAGEKGHRYITQNTSVMSHQYSWGSKGKEHELMSIVKEFELSTDRMMDHYVKCTGKNVSYIRKNLLPESDCWLTTEETIKHGIADHVIQTY